MTLQERIQAEHAKAARLFVHRQELEQQRQMVTQQCAACDLELAKSDGRIAMLEDLSKEPT